VAPVVQSRTPMRKNAIVWLLSLSLAVPVARADDLIDARRLRKSGAGIMGVGLVVLGAGLALGLGVAGIAAQCEHRPRGCGDGLGLALIPSFILLPLGGMVTGVGMPMLFVGRKRERRIQRQRAPTLVPMGQLTPVPPMPQ
jgi:hypothetical protein